ncbi:nuclear transcription factor Y subunit B-10 isoform X3 [Canna indica]|uniref:Nuclear transcription factor Y subunit B-10 isoform X3 n=1 Tax=Canna indica TaxID=4628 RepID=A0AAQ3KX66_9LILI|nr:nuclear transcription factor Y subunit B-10 isoform X3 [Canna indica]
MSDDSPKSPAGKGKRPHESSEESPRSVDGVDEVIREQDKYLPVANVLRIMKKALPANAKIAKDAKETMQLCVSEFISFITCEAGLKCMKEKRKTINGDDVLVAIATFGFEDYIEPLRLYLLKYREVSKQGFAQGMDYSNSMVPQQGFPQGMDYPNASVRKLLPVTF